MNITSIHRIQRTVRIGGQAVKVQKLSVPLPFARKPARLDEVSRLSLDDENVPVYILETKEMTEAEFDAFASSLLASRDWLDGKGGRAHDDGCLCVEVVAPGRSRLYVNPEGSDYARYVARLG